MLPTASLLAAATLWGLLWYPLRLLDQAGMQGLWSTLLIYLAACAALPFMRGQRVAGALDLRWLIVLGAAAGWCNTSFVLAVIHGEVARVLLLFYLSPVWAIALARVVLAEHLTVRSAAVIALALSGASAMLWDDRTGVPWPRTTGDWLALSAGIAFAVANVATRKQGQVSLNAKAAATWVGGVAMALAWILVVGEPIPSVGFGPVFGALALGLSGMVAMTLLVLYGVSQMPIQRSAVILLFEIVVGAVSAQLLAGELMGVREWCGGALIVAACVVAARSPGRRSLVE